MVRDFTADDQGKKVMTADGDMVGTIHEVRDGRAHVKPDATLSRGIRRTLGWSGEEETYELRKGNVDKIAGDEVHLKSNL